MCKDNYFRQLLACPRPTAPLCRTDGLRAFNSGSVAGGGIPPWRLPPWERRTLPGEAGLGQGYPGRCPLAGEHSRAARSQVSPSCNLCTAAPPTAPGAVRGAGGRRSPDQGGRRQVLPSARSPAAGAVLAALSGCFAVLPPRPACRPGFTVPGPPGVRERSFRRPSSRKTTATKARSPRGLPPGPPQGPPRGPFLGGAPFSARRGRGGAAGRGQRPPGLQDRSGGGASPRG